MKKVYRVFLAVFALFFVFLAKPSAANLVRVDLGSWVDGYTVVADNVSYFTSGTVTLPNVTQFNESRMSLSPVPLSVFQTSSDQTVTIYDLQADFSLYGSPGILAFFGTVSSTCSLRGGWTVNATSCEIYDANTGTWEPVVGGWTSSQLQLSQARVRWFYRVGGVDLSNPVELSFAFPGSNVPVGSVSSLTINLNDLYAEVTQVVPSSATDDILDVITTDPDSTDLDSSMSSSVGDLSDELSGRAGNFVSTIQGAVDAFASFTGLVGTEAGTFLSAFLTPFLNINLIVGNVALNLGAVIIGLALLVFVIFIVRLIFGLHKKDKGDGDD